MSSPGDQLAVNRVTLSVTGSGKHACIHPDLPGSDNNGYLVNGIVLHPRDELTPPHIPVRVLLVPAGGPWMKLQESVDFLRAVSPATLVPAGTDVVVVDPGTAYVPLRSEPHRRPAHRALPLRGTATSSGRMRPSAIRPAETVGRRPRAGEWRRSSATG